MGVADIYFSADIESDGPIPGQYSMLSVGLAVAGTFDGDEFRRAGGEAPTFYRELQPISPNFEPEAVAVTGLNRENLLEAGLPAEQAMAEAKDWVALVTGDRTPVLVGFPLVFDWMFLYWYFVRFAKGSPFSFSSGLDMKSIYQAKARVLMSLAGKDDLPPFLKGARPHTHNALDDAVEQAEIFGNLFEWDGTGRS